MKYAFINDHAKEFPVYCMCKVLAVSRSGFYDWRDRPLSQRAKSDTVLLGHIQRVHQQNRQAYGAIKTWKALNGQRIECGKHKVARLRRENGIEAKRQKRYKMSRQSKPHRWVAPNCLQRCFQAAYPNQIWVGDVTFVPTREGWLHLAMLLDLYSRSVVGWAMSARNDQQLVLSALEMAIEHRQPGPGLIHHTDRGRLYASEAYRELLSRHQMIPSMSRKGDCYDNAVAESFFSNLKNELTYHHNFNTRDEARSAIFDYIELFYNRQRLHQTLGYQTPNKYEMMTA